MNKPGYLKPILLGGTVAGILSGLPCLAAGNCICCMWVIAGGVLGSYIFVQSCTGYYPTDGDGALVGLGSGAFGGLIAGILNGLFTMITGPAQYEQMMAQMQNVPPEMQEFMEQMMQFAMPGSPVFIVFGIIFNVMIFSAVATLGGFIGLRIFLPRRFGPYPPGGMPPGYGGGYPPPGMGGPGMPGGGYPPPGGPMPQGPTGGPPGPGEPPGGPQGPQEPPPGGQGGGAPPPSWGGQ
jgi:hypothetical protein